VDTPESPETTANAGFTVGRQQIDRTLVMASIRAGTWFDKRYVPYGAYQLFLDESRDGRLFFQPEHWTSDRFPVGESLLPVVGIRKADAESFCEWLSTSRALKFRLPKPGEFRELGLLDNHGSEGDAHGYWTDTSLEIVKQLPKAKFRKYLLNLIKEDGEHTGGTSPELREKFLNRLDIVLGNGLNLSGSRRSDLKFEPKKLKQQRSLLLERARILLAEPEDRFKNLIFFQTDLISLNLYVYSREELLDQATFLYIGLALLDARTNRVLPAFEGLRIVGSNI